jgi:dedicated sortase system histidine kinase
LFDAPAAPRESLVVERSQEATAADSTAATSAPPAASAGGSGGTGGTGGSAEIAQIVQGLSRTTARIFVIDRELNVLARAGSLKRPLLPDAQAAVSGAGRVWQWLERETLHPLYALVLKQPSEDFGEEQAGRVALPAREIDGALSGILTVDRRPTPDGKAVIVSAAHPIWVGDQVKGAVIVEETTNAVLAERDRAFERLFSIVLAALLLGSVALTLYAARLSARIRRLRDEAEAAIDAQGRVRGVLAGSDAGDEIGDLSRSFSSVLSRLAQYASYREQMASRLSHELRTPIAVVRSSLDNLKLSPLPDDARVYMERAQQGLNRLTHILTRMTEATRLEQSVGEDERERFDLGRVLTGCVDGYRVAYPQHTLKLELPSGEVIFNGAPEMIAQMLDKLVANAVEVSAAGTPIVVRLEREGPLLPDTMGGRLFDSMVSVRGDQASDAPHLGLGLYIVRLIAEAHRGRAMAQNRDDGRGVVVSVALPYAAVS